MQFKKMTPNLMVEDLPKTISFYRDLLNFEIVMTVPDKEPFEWVLMQSGKLELMFQTRDSLARDMAAFQTIPAGGALTLYIEIEGIMEFHQKLRGHAQFSQQLHETFYGMREFSIRDPNGFILSFAEPVEGAG